MSTKNGMFFRSPRDEFGGGGGGGENMAFVATDPEISISFRTFAIYSTLADRGARLYSEVSLEGPAVPQRPCHLPV